MASSTSYIASPSFSSYRALAFRIPQIPSPHSLSSGHLSFQGKTCIRVRNSPSRPTKVFSVLESKTADISGKSWDKLVLNSETPVLVEFYAPWCGPCKMVHRVIDELATEYAGRLQCFTLQADKHPEIAENYDIKAVPIVLLFKNGQKCDSVVGTMPKEFYVTAIEKVIAS